MSRHGVTRARGAPLNRAARDGEIRRRLALRAVARALRLGDRAAGAVGGMSEGRALDGVRLRPGIRGRGGAVTVAAVAAAGPLERDRRALHTWLTQEHQPALASGLVRAPDMLPPRRSRSKDGARAHSCTTP